MKHTRMDALRLFWKLSCTKELYLGYYEIRLSSELMGWQGKMVSLQNYVIKKMIQGDILKLAKESFNLLPEMSVKQRKINRSFLNARLFYEVLSNLDKMTYFPHFKDGDTEDYINRLIVFREFRG